MNIGDKVDYEWRRGIIVAFSVDILTSKVEYVIVGYGVWKVSKEVLLEQWHKVD